jgi:hypothetical protein
MHRYIKKYLRQFFISSYLLLCLSSCFSQKAKQSIKGVPNLTGSYKKSSSNEILLLNADSTFIYIRNHIQKSDVIIPLCDTLAKGFWNQREGFITLRNSFDFNKIDYSIVESELKSKDSIYFKIILPEEDALNYKNFKFSIIPSPLYGQFNESTKPEFAITNKSWGNVTFGFLIQNIAPNCDYGRKPYQRIYFNVFERYKPKSSSSTFFTITVKNFNQCFYEAMDVDGEVIGIESDSLFWAGSTYRKIK